MSNYISLFYITELRNYIKEWTEQTQSVLELIMNALHAYLRHGYTCSEPPGLTNIGELLWHTSNDLTDKMCL